jgi:hypothetical protein
VCGKEDGTAYYMAPKTHVVAISDHNDLLSYPLRDWQLDLVRAPGEVTNIFVQLTRPIGWVANPKKAHMGHDRNDEVIKIVACGTKDEKPQAC